MPEPIVTTQAIGDGAVSGGIAGGLIIAGKELVMKIITRNGKRPITGSQMKAAIDEATKEKVNAKDVENNMLKHKLECTQTLSTKFDEIKMLIMNGQEKQRLSFDDSLRRIHDRIDVLGKR